jgi:hypothetical protein
MVWSSRFGFFQQQGNTMKLFCATFRSSSFKAALLTVIAAAAAAPMAPAHAGVNDPLGFLYIFPGATDFGGGNSPGVGYCR